VQDPIAHYIDTQLTPQLEALGLAAFPDAARQVTTDVRQRLQSLLSRWHDAGVRHTLLLVGREEGAFYEPRSAPLPIRALVVVAVRNSLLEDLGAAHSSLLPPGLSDFPLHDSDVRPITQAAIEHWCAVDLQQAVVDPPPLEADVFGRLAQDFPHAWHALSHLAGTAEQTVSFAPCRASRPRLPMATIDLDDAPGSLTRVIVSGISSTYDSTLVAHLRAIRSGSAQVLFSDCWKMLTRHPGKLFEILNFVLAHGGSIVTHNYLLTPTLACARKPLLRPAHNRQEMKVKFLRSEGLLPPHRAMLEALHFG
jgi:hypothetical protein